MKRTAFITATVGALAATQAPLSGFVPAERFTREVTFTLQCLRVGVLAFIDDGDPAPDDAIRARFRLPPGIEPDQVAHEAKIDRWMKSISDVTHNMIAGDSIEVTFTTDFIVA